jgi:hypothetical protein
MSSGGLFAAALFADQMEPSVELNQEFNHYILSPEQEAGLSLNDENNVSKASYKTPAHCLASVVFPFPK